MTNKCRAEFYEDSSIACDCVTGECPRIKFELDPEDFLARACNLAGLPYETFLKIKAYLPVQHATTAHAPAQEFNKSVADAEIKALYVESQGSDKG